MTLKQAGYGQANIVEDIICRISTEFQHQANMVNSAPPEYPAPQIATGATEIIQQVLDQNQELMHLLSSNNRKSYRKNTNRTPTTSNGNFQGQPRQPTPKFVDKYFWKHWRGSHKGRNCNSKAPGNKEKATIESNMDKSSYGCTQWRCGTLLKVETDNNRNILMKSTDSTLFPPKFMSYKHAILNKSRKIITLKDYTDATGNFIRGQEIIILKNPEPTTTGPRFRLPENYIVQPTIFGHLPLPMLT